MTTTTTSYLTEPQRRLLNIVFEMHGPSSVASVLERADASLDDLDPLQDEYGLIHGLLYNSAPVNIRNLHDTGHAARWRATVGLTASGRLWVTTNPTNVLLRSVDMKPGKRMDLGEALGFSDRQTISDAVEGGLLELCHAATGEPVSRRGRTAAVMPAEFAYCSAYTLKATSKIRQVLG